MLLGSFINNTRATHGFADASPDNRQRTTDSCASPDYKTTSQQDNEWGFADNGQQTTDNRQQNLGYASASPDDYVDL